jgi:hypothetical protein
VEEDPMEDAQRKDLLVDIKNQINRVLEEDIVKL